MAARRHERIEPSFGGSELGDDDFRISADDRAVPNASSGPRRKTAKKPVNDRKPAKPAASSRRGRGKTQGGGGSGRGGGRRRRSFLGHVFRLFLMLGVVGGLTVAAIVGYMAVKLPQEAWAIPDRPPNVKIVSVAGELMANRGLTGGRKSRWTR
mgnify:FL=1